MRLFTLVVDPTNRGIPEPVRRAYERVPLSHGLQFRWVPLRQAAVLTAWDNGHGNRLVATHDGFAAVGTVRLDNRAEILRWLGGCPESMTDLELILQLVARYGTKLVPRLLGDFGFVVWNAVTRTAMGACDAFRVKPLYYAEQNGLVAFASRAEALAVEERYELQVLAEWVAGCSPSPELSVFEGVKHIPAGSMAILERGNVRTVEYWSPENIQAQQPFLASEREAPHALRDLLIEAIQLRLDTNGDTWAQLSGGLDSSSIVSVAQWLVERGEIGHGLVGTVTYVDRQGTRADERQYSETILKRWQIRNETIVDPPIWFDEGHALPRLDQPRPDLMLYPRERRLCEIVGSANGRVLLTGQGSDELLRGNMFFFADWLTWGRRDDAVREMARRAALGRVSFWELAYRNAMVPLLPRALRLWLGPEVTRVPSWVTKAVTRRYGLQDKAFEMALYTGRVGHKYHDAVATCVRAVGRTIGHLILEDALDVRHPFLYRPLVEFGLRLPPDLCVRPHARKWVLREAMRGILPEAVRLRVGKGSPTERHAWSLNAQRDLLEPLVTDSMLADFGVVDAAKLRAAFHSAPCQSMRKGDPHGVLQGVLAIEAWLQMRTGRWPRGGHLNSARSVVSTNNPSTEGSSRSVV